MSINRFLDQKAKKKKKRDRQPWRREEEFVINPSIYRGELDGRGEGEWLAVAPCYLEEGLLHSEAGQQNWWAMSSSSSSLRDRQTNRQERQRRREEGRQEEERKGCGRKNRKEKEKGREEEEEEEEEEEVWWREFKFRGTVLQSATRCQRSHIWDRSSDLLSVTVTVEVKQRRLGPQLISQIINFTQSQRWQCSPAAGRMEGGGMDGGMMRGDGEAFGSFMMEADANTNYCKCDAGRKCVLVWQSAQKTRLFSVTVTISRFCFLDSLKSSTS